MDLRHHHHRVLKAIVVASGFILVARIAGAAKEMAIAARFGIDAIVDAYVFDMTLLNWPIGVAMSIMTATVMPILARKGPDGPGIPLFRQQFLGLMLAVGCLAAVVTAGAIHTLVSTGVIPFEEAGRGYVLSMVWPLAVIMPLGMTGIVYACILMAEERHLNSLIEGVPALVLAVTVIVAPFAGEAVLVGGTVAGFVLQLIVLLAVQRPGSRGWPRISMSSPLWRLAASAMLVMGIAQSIAATIEIVDQITAASLGEGANATLGYATRVLALFLGLGGLAIVRAILPIFAGMDGDGAGNRDRLATQWMLIMFGMGLLGVAIAWPLAPFGIGILFERGTFTAADIEAVAALFRTGLFQIPSYFAFIILVQRLISEGRYILLVAQTVLTLMAKIVLNHVLTQAYGLQGIMLSTSAVAAFTLVVLIVLSRTRYGFPRSRVGSGE